MTTTAENTEPSGCQTATIDRDLLQDPSDAEYAMIFRSTVRRDPRYKKVLEFFARNDRLQVLQEFEDVCVETAIQMTREQTKGNE